MGEKKKEEEFGEGDDHFFKKPTAGGSPFGREADIEIVKDDSCFSPPRRWRPWNRRSKIS